MTSPRSPAVLASVGCGAGPTATANGRLYVACADGKVVAISLATDTVVKTYPIQRPWSPQPTCAPEAGVCVGAPPPSVDSVVVEGALWVQWSDSDLQRFDLNSGKLTGDASDVNLVGVDSGSVWVQNSPTGVVAVSADGPIPQALSSMDSTWATTTIACGSMWQIQDSYLNPVDTVARIDPHTGATLWEAPIPGSSYHPLSVIDVGSTCWAAYS
ncbi:MAG TPA: hypothetical protein VF337_08270, partial [Candidatus Limnocylindrales bacterium]